MEQHDLGKRAEDIANDYLKGKGYEILDRNWQLGHKEIDIVARDHDFLVVVEVKGRKGNILVEPEDAVNRRKQRFLIQAANAYVQKFDIDQEVRFDIITVVFQGKKHRINHIPDAFYPIFCWYTTIYVTRQVEQIFSAFFIYRKNTFFACCVFGVENCTM